MVGDSAAVIASVLAQRESVDKIFVKGKMMFGVAGSFRILQLLRYVFEIPKHPKGMDDLEYMCSIFVNEFKECLKQSESFRVYNEGEVTFDSAIIAAYKGKLFKIEEDFSVFESSRFMSVGCGEDYALGALFALEQAGYSEDPVNLMKIAMQSAYEYSIGVRPPFYCYKLKGKDFEIYKME
jgi:ATP-dependent protease HslVU (ClpYQ) peptidase subunit